MHAVVLQGADHLQSGAIADVTQSFPGVPAEGALENFAVLGAIENGAPALQFSHSIGCFLRMQLSHAPVV